MAAALIWGRSTDITLTLSKPYWPGRLLLAGSVLLLIPLAAVLAALSALVQLIAASSTPDNDGDEDDGEGDFT